MDLDYVTVEERARYHELCLKMLDRWAMTRADFKEYERLDWKIRKEEGESERTLSEKRDTAN